MTSPRQLATVRSYDELIAALRARSLELNATREAIDEVAGLQKGYTAKVLAPAAPKGLGRISMGPLLGALGVVLVMVEDAESRAVKRVGGGKLSYQLNGAENAPVILKFSRRKMRKMALASAAARMKKIPASKRRAIARKAGKARGSKCGPERLSEVGRMAAKARWSKPKLVEITASQAQPEARNRRTGRNTGSAADSPAPAPPRSPGGRSSRT